ncbi:MAG: DUF354 domain-containing protein [Candidatus Aminicenantes bacterium]|nr:DUF354 domain-containing protein [Candidatus Aminicenantes bacterium]MCK5003974.1 DUF354 domain-containing protein [Candidatus Aminicenantes bacterium]
MRFLFDIGHPAEVHTFRVVINNLRKKGHDVLITARDKEMTHYLLDFYNIPYISTGKNLGSKAGKIWAFIRNDLKILKAAISFKPDLIINFFSPFAAHVGKIMGKKVIGFHDTEHANLTIRLAKPFTDTIVVPSCYKREYPGKSVIKFNGNFELAYLHPKHFKPDNSIFKILGLKKNEKYVLLRFVTHTAMHDSGHKGFSDEEKIKITEKFSDYAKVFISSEVPLPDRLNKYELKIPPERIHDVINFASLLFGESATMASEAAVLGVPSIFFDFSGRGYTDEEEQEYGLVFNYKNTEEDQELALLKGVDIISANNRKKWIDSRQRLLADTIDVSAFMGWFIEGYPESEQNVLKDPEIPLKFK